MRTQAFQYSESLFYSSKWQKGSHCAQRATVHLYIKSWRVALGTEQHTSFWHTVCLALPFLIHGPIVPE